MGDVSPGWAENFFDEQKSIPPTVTSIGLFKITGSVCYWLRGGQSKISVPLRQQDNNRRNCWSVPGSSGPEYSGTDQIFLTHFPFHSASNEKSALSPLEASSRRYPNSGFKACEIPTLANTTRGSPYHPRWRSDDCHARNRIGNTCNVSDFSCNSPGGATRYP